MSLLYIATESDSEFAQYDQRYRADPFAFPIHPANAAFAVELMQSMASIAELAILEIGCGQGQYLSGMVDVATYLRSYKQVQAVGLDGSSVAIKQAAARDSRIDWVADRMQNFLGAHTVRYDLVMDRGGNTIVSGEAEAREMFQHFARLLKPGGIYAYVISKSWYDGGMRTAKFHRAWQKDWIALAKESFPGFRDASTEGHYQLCFSL